MSHLAVAEVQAFLRKGNCSLVLMGLDGAAVFTPQTRPLWYGSWTGIGIGDSRSLLLSTQHQPNQRHSSPETMAGDCCLGTLDEKIWGVFGCLLYVFEKCLHITHGTPRSQISSACAPAFNAPAFLLLGVFSPKLRKDIVG